MKNGTDQRVLNLVRILSVAFVVLLAARIAWVSDDALITLRTALNITHGWGPGYNATESVQAFTHPLWFVLWTSIGAATNQWILGMLAASLLLLAAAVGLLVWRMASLPRIVVVVGMLIMSNAFMEYATSGLEGPLAFALVAGLAAATLPMTASDSRPPGRGIGNAIGLGLLVSGVTLTRFDLVLLVAPLAVLLAWRSRSKWRQLIAGAVAFGLPLVAWFAWSWATYRTLLPNTFEAKRNVQIPSGELVVQGLRYVAVSIEHDPVTALLLAAGIGLALAIGTSVARTWAVGIVIYLGYVVWIGGDFMAGRFLAVPALVAAFLLATTPSPFPARSQSPDPATRNLAGIGVAVLSLLAVLGMVDAAGAIPTALVDPQAPRWNVDQNLNAGVSDERGVWVANGMSLRNIIDNLSLAYVTPPLVPLGDGSGLSRTLRGIDFSAREWPTSDGYFTLPAEVGELCGGLGYTGIATGPITHLVDSCALTDRYLAGQPFVPGSPWAWKPGHFHRAVPDGYIEAVRFDDLSRISDMGVRHDVSEVWELIRR